MLNLAIYSKSSSISDVGSDVYEKDEMKTSVQASDSFGSESSSVPSTSGGSMDNVPSASSRSFVGLLASGGNLDDNVPKRASKRLVKHEAPLECIDHRFGLPSDVEVIEGDAVGSSQWAQAIISDMLAKNCNYIGLNLSWNHEVII